MSATEKYEVIIVGLGPTGLVAAALLGKMKHRVLVIEKHPSLYPLPRCGHVDHEILRLLQELGTEKEFLADAFPVEDYLWYNGKGEELVTFRNTSRSVSGYNNDYMMYQPVLDDCIQSAIKKVDPYVTIRRGHEVVAVNQSNGKTTVEAFQYEATPDGQGKQVGPKLEFETKYVIAADGARSKIRESCGIQRDMKDFHALWLDVDVFVKRPLPKTNPYQICDPVRPKFIAPLGKRHHRYEWCIKPEDNAEEFSKPAKAWELLAAEGVGPDDVEIRRQQIYEFGARMAEDWRHGNIFIGGDAAHTMPPYMGQGACSGMRDSENLAWKLDLVLRGIASDRLLDSYQVEREPFVRTWVDLSIRYGEVSCTLDPEKAAARDKFLLSGEAPPMPEFPKLTGGVLYKTEAGVPIAPAGTLFLQREVEKSGKAGLFDDVVGRGFLLVGRNQDPRSGLNERELQLLKTLDVTVTWMGSPSQCGPQQFIDSTGEYAQLFDQISAQAILVRPDHFIFGAAANVQELQAVLGQLSSQLALQNR